jgi:hypothetical protein
MSPPEDTNRPESADRNGPGVLANLPRTRPQRSSARRAAARSADRPAEGAPATAGENGASPPAARSAKGSGAAQTKPAGRAKAPKATPAARAARAAKPSPGAPASGSASAGAKPPSASKARKSTPAKRPGTGAASKPRAQASATTTSESVPRQGFASEGDRVSGPVAPPGRAEFLATAAEIVNELAKAGLSSGERLVRDVLARLPLS